MSPELNDELELGTLPCSLPISLVHESGLKLTIDANGNRQLDVLPICNLTVDELKDLRQALDTS